MVTYGLIKRQEVSPEVFDTFCKLCHDRVVLENLKTNGGTLLFPHAVFCSNALLLATIEDEIIGFLALGLRDDNQAYITQIAVKNEYKRQGIGREFINLTTEITEEIIADVKSFNSVSQQFFEALGFTKDLECSSETNYLYRNKINTKQKRKENYENK